MRASACLWTIHLNNRNSLETLTIDNSLIDFCLIQFTHSLCAFFFVILVCVWVYFGVLMRLCAFVASCHRLYIFVYVCVGFILQFVSQPHWAIVYIFEYGRIYLKTSKFNCDSLRNVNNREKIANLPISTGWHIEQYWQNILIQFCIVFEVFFSVCLFVAVWKKRH